MSNFEHINIVKPSATIIDEPNVPKKIEKIARTCYKSENKITDTSYIGMLNNLIKNRHYAMLEHGSLIFQTDTEAYNQLQRQIRILSDKTGYRTYLRLTCMPQSERYIVSGNIRAWIEFFEISLAHQVQDNNAFLNTRLVEAVCFAPDGTKRWSPIFDAVYGKLSDAIWKDPRKFAQVGNIHEITPEDLTNEEKLIHEDVSVKFTCDRGVSHEIVRHRPASFAQESTRYCNYGKMNKDRISVIDPAGLNLTDEDYSIWKNSMEECAICYLALLNNGCAPQEARSVLPNSLKTEINMTTNLQEWKHFLNLRACGTTGMPHPQMAEVAVPLLEEFKKRYPDIFKDMEPVDIKPKEDR